MIGLLVIFITLISINLTSIINTMVHDHIHLNIS